MIDDEGVSMTLIEPKDRIDVLLKEYDTLRSEIIGRINSRFTVLGLGVGLGLASLNVGSWSVWKAGSIGLLLVGLSAAALTARHWIRKCSARLADIEVEVNSLAGGAALLKWESSRRSPAERGKVRPGKVA